MVIEGIAHRVERIIAKSQIWVATSHPIDVAPGRQLHRFLPPRPTKPTTHNLPFAQSLSLPRRAWVHHWAGPLGACSREMKWGALWAGDCCAVRAEDACGLVALEERDKASNWDPIWHGVRPAKGSNRLCGWGRWHCWLP